MWLALSAFKIYALFPLLARAMPPKKKAKTTTKQGAKRNGGPSWKRRGLNRLQALTFQAHGKEWAAQK